MAARRTRRLLHPVLQRPVEHGVEHPAAGGAARSRWAAFWKVVKWGTTFRPIERAEVGVVGQVLGQPPVVEARELLEHQAGQELRLGELLGAELVACAELLAGRLVGDPEHPSR